MNISLYLVALKTRKKSESNDINLIFYTNILFDYPRTCCIKIRSF